MTRSMVDYSSLDSPYGSNDEHGVGNSFDLANALIKMKEELRSCKEYNERIMQK